jgi:hypothetical protein
MRRSPVTDALESAPPPSDRAPEVMARLAASEAVDPKTSCFRVAPTFETASNKHDGLNRILAVGISRRERSGPIYAVHEVL